MYPNLIITYAVGSSLETRRRRSLVDFRRGMYNTRRLWHDCMLPTLGYGRRLVNITPPESRLYVIPGTAPQNVGLGAHSDRRC